MNKGKKKNLKDCDINQLFPKIPAKYILSGHRLFYYAKI